MSASSVYDIETKMVHSGQDSSTASSWQKTVPDITYVGNEAQENETQNLLEKCIATLEHAKYAICYPSGVGAISSVSQILEAGDHAVVFDSVYHGTRTYLNVIEQLGKIELTFVDLCNADNLKNHLRRNTKMVWIETPCNPTMKIVDIAAISKIIKDRRSNAFLVVDNTFMSPYFQNPLLLGADISMHSLTKYMGGHSDCLMGAIATNDDLLYKKLKALTEVIGAAPSPMECFLVCRSLKTLHVRMKKHMENAMAIANYLENHPKVEKVLHPGLKSHPQHELAMKQCRGFSGMVSFCIRGGQAAAVTFVKSLKIFMLAVSLGSVESLIEISSLMTASPLTKEKQEELEITGNLIRMSIGLESVKDLIADLDQAFEKI